jgi:transposase InsO family protein
MDFTSDSLTGSRRFLTFNVVDDFHRAALALDIDFSLPAKHAIRALAELVARHGCPRQLRCDNGSEFNLRQTPPLVPRPQNRVALDPTREAHPKRLH